MFKLVFSTVVFICLLSISVLSSTATAFQGKGCMGDCKGCHTLTNAEASKLLKTKKFKARITDIKGAPVKGIWEVSIKKGGKNFTVYVDFGKKYLMQSVSFMPLDKIGKTPELKKVSLKDIPLEGAILIGDAKAKKKVIVFDDPECPYCKKLHKEIKKIVSKRRDIAFYIKLFPLPIHPDAYGQSKAIVCAKSAAMLDDAFAGKKLAPATCDTDEIDNNLELGKKLGINGTPAIIFPDGRLLPGFVTEDVLIELIDKADKGKK